MGGSTTTNQTFIFHGFFGGSKGGNRFFYQLQVLELEASLDNFLLKHKFTDVNKPLLWSEFESLQRNSILGFPTKKHVSQSKVCQMFHVRMPFGTVRCCILFHLNMLLFFDSLIIASYLIAFHIFSLNMTKPYGSKYLLRRYFSPQIVP